MKRLLLTLMAILALGSLEASAAKLTVASASDNPAVRKDVEAYMNVEKFHDVVIDFVASVKFVQSDSSRVEAVGPERIIRRTNCEVKDGVLKIFFEKGEDIKMRRGEKMQLIIYSPTISRICLQGVGNLKAPGTIKTQSLEIVNDGVGNIVFDDLQCQKVTVICNGVGNISLKGNTESAVYKSDGVGTIKCYEMISKSTTVSLSGVGGVECFASESCELVNEGIGSISYKGNPEVENIKKSGIGKISRR